MMVIKCMLKKRSFFGYICVEISTSPVIRQIVRFVTLCDLEAKYFNHQCGVECWQPYQKSLFRNDGEIFSEQSSVQYNAGFER